MLNTTDTSPFITVTSESDIKISPSVANDYHHPVVWCAIRLNHYYYVSHLELHLRHAHTLPVNNTRPRAQVRLWFLQTIENVTGKYNTVSATNTHHKCVGQP